MKIEVEVTYARRRTKPVHTVSKVIQASKAVPVNLKRPGSSSPRRNWCSRGQCKDTYSNCERKLKQLKALDNLQNWKYVPHKFNQTPTLMDQEYLDKNVQARRNNNKIKEIDEYLEKQDKNQNNKDSKISGLQKSIEVSVQ